MRRSPEKLRTLTDGVHAWLPDGRGTWGWANCLVVETGDGGALVVDTPYTAVQTRKLQDAARHLLGADLVFRTVVTTHANGDHAFGACLFPEAELVAGARGAAHAQHEPGPREMEALLAATDTPAARAADPAFGWYTHSHFPLDYAELTPRTPTRLVRDRERLRLGALDVEVIEVAPAHTDGDVLVHLPAQRTVATGDIVFSDGHPVHWAGPLSRVIAAAEAALALDPQIVVPGHGPVLTPAELAEHVTYLRELRAWLHDAHARGRTAWQAGEELVEKNAHHGWALEERQFIVAAMEYRHLDAAPGEEVGPADVPALLAPAAQAAYAREGGRELTRIWATEDV